jgi:putative transposase
MARKLRVQFQGAIYHVTARGVERRIIFDDDRDREHFVQRLEECVDACGVRLYLFCLMSNHFHFLVETPQGNLSAFMHKIQTAHTVFYNLRHKRCGHLLQGRYSAKLVEGDNYLYSLSRYIHLNPVYVGINMKKALEERIRLLRNYKWSSYSGYAGFRGSWRFVTEEPVLEMATGRKDKDKRKAYRRFVEAGVANSDDEFIEVLKNSVWGIGGDEFCAKVRDMHTKMTMCARRREDVAFRRIDLHVKPDEVIKVVADILGVTPETLKQRCYGSWARAIAAKMLIRYSGLNQRDAGIHLNIGTGAAVSQQLSALRMAVVDDSLARSLDEIEEVLAEKAKI